MNTTPEMQQIPHSASYLAISREQMFHVLDYSPLMGCSGTTVTIDTLFKHRNPSSDIHIRIVIGCKPIPTHIENIGGDKWRCTGSAPEFIAQKFSLTHTVNISIEAVVSRNVVVDSVAFGYFTYREYDHYLSIPLHPGALDAFCEGNPYHLHLARPPTAHSAPSHEVAAPSHEVAQSRTSPAAVEDRGSEPTPAPNRTLRRYDNRTDSGHDPVSLELDGDLKHLGRNLTDEELSRRRRLVRFIRKEEGNTIRLSFHPIREEDYSEDSFVISCIYREDSHDTCLTSVDMMKLVEFISQEECNHEKGRLRRNLEFLRPTTVSRTVRPHLFHILMEFSAPKPRTIEKSIKLFKWSSLVTGLHKIMEKYAWTKSPVAQPSNTSEGPPPTRKRARSPTSTPGPPTKKPRGTSHGPGSNPHATFASFDGTHHPSDSSTQLELVPATHVNPSWLHPENAFIGSPAPAPSPFACGSMSAQIPRAHLTPDAEVGHNSQSLTHYESFHHFDSLDLQPLHVHSTHAGMVSPFI